MEIYFTLNGIISFEVEGMSFIALLFVHSDLLVYVETLD
jgi:hypothetical protein